MPTQWALNGARMVSPLACVAPLNLPFWLVVVEEMSTQLKALVAGSKTPTQSIWCGAKMTRPLLAVVAPWKTYPEEPLMAEEMSTQLKALVAGSKTPTQPAVAGPKTTRPLLTGVAPTNLSL